MKMKGFAMRAIGKTGWIEKDVPACGPLDAIVRPIVVSPCTSDIHTVWEGAIGERTDMRRLAWSKPWASWCAIFARATA